MAVAVAEAEAAGVVARRRGVDIDMPAHWPAADNSQQCKLIKLPSRDAPQGPCSMSLVSCVFAITIYFI